ncbi:hypothetical protein EV191_101127 [Tamaricihabitans halophyticus]|uniref:Ig-like domain-containing protein n=1 Tax=Tamaricihabitans halophyticus TaxID=1262583 RepID=A0A4R2R2E2_9PSEU|nr:hypothetical protein [Tamaricihabitans halophyticus]TCP56187.1 hypothetical protein EV191_101127 [Tamaricihabitans halophyticus]
MRTRRVLASIGFAVLLAAGSGLANWQAAAAPSQVDEVYCEPGSDRVCGQLAVYPRPLHDGLPRDHAFDYDPVNIIAWCETPDGNPVETKLTEYEGLSEPWPWDSGNGYQARIGPGIEPGTYQVRADCNGQPMQTSYTVVESGPQPPGNIDLRQLVARPGERVSLHFYCEPGYLPTNGVSSPVLTDIAYEGELDASATIRQDAPPGVHEVTLRCGPGEQGEAFLRGAFHVR